MQICMQKCSEEQAAVLTEMFVHGECVFSFVWEWPHTVSGHAPHSSLFRYQITARVQHTHTHIHDKGSVIFTERVKGSKLIKQNSFSLWALNFILLWLIMQCQNIILKCITLNKTTVIMFNSMLIFFFPKKIGTFSWKLNDKANKDMQNLHLKLSRQSKITFWAFWALMNFNIAFIHTQTRYIDITKNYIHIYI